jgi:hypothetical protein
MLRNNKNNKNKLNIDILFVVKSISLISWVKEKSNKHCS